MEEFYGEEKIAYKLCRKLKNGEIKPLFIDKKKSLEFDVWVDAECHPTKGFKVRPYWHSTNLPLAPHLTEKGRVWVECIIKDYKLFDRPSSQGGLWYLSKKIKLVRELSDEKVKRIIRISEMIKMLKNTKED